MSGSALVFCARQQQQQTLCLLLCTLYSVLRTCFMASMAAADPISATASEANAANPVIRSQMLL
jgi:hypothetical protein